MNKKLTAAFLVTVFVLSIILIAAPVQAHHVGRPTGTTPYRVYDFDPHVPGPTGYVWPGAGVMSLSTGQGAPSPVTWGQGHLLPPGYQSPFSTNPQNAPTSWYQLAGNTYAPFGAILTSTEDSPNVGDLIFAINFTTLGMSGNPHYDAGEDFAYHSITIYIPPEFEPPSDWLGWDTSNIVTTITNERGAIAVWQADVKDPIGPGWWVIWIHPGWWRGQGAGNFNPTTNSREILFSENNEYNEWYYIRVNGMTAPKIAGRYFFKMFLDEHIPNMNVAVPPEGGGGLDTTIISSQGYPATVPVENYPCLLVKGEVDPGIIEGTVRYGAWNQQLYNLPLGMAGRVRAVGVADDPYTGASTGRMVEARGYFNASAKGHYEVEGVAPGVYDIYASAAGYPEVLVASGVKIFPGKSFHLDFHLQPGPIITGVIFSKHSFGEVPWPSTRPITVEIYDSNEWPSARPGYPWGSEGLEFELGTGEVWTDMGYKIVDAHLKSFSPINLTDSPYSGYVEGNVIYDATGASLLAPNVPRLVAFPIEGPVSAPSPPLQGWVNEIDTAITNPLDPTYGKSWAGLFNGVGPAQYWWVDPLGDYTNGGGSNSFRYQFGIKGYYGAPMIFDGHVPQVYATFIDGLTPGTYFTRAWINGYVQTDVSGNYVDYPFTVAAEEWAGDINTPMDVQTSSWINKTVHFHDLPGTLDVQPIRGPDDGRFLIGELVDSDGIPVGMNFTYVPATANTWGITINGYGMHGPMPDQGQGQLSEYPPPGMKFFNYKYRHIRDYGIMPGTYTIHVYMRGYVQQEFELASITVSQSPAIISNHMYRGAGINVTLYSIDWQHPRVDRPWTFPTDIIKVGVYDEEGNHYGWIKYYDGGWVYPYQEAYETTVPWPDWPAGASKLKFNGSWQVDAWGPDLEGWLTGNYYYIYGWHPGVDWGLDQGGTTPEDGKFALQTGIWLEFGYDWCGFLVNPWRYTVGYPEDYTTILGLETGIYTLKAFTLGYVQKKDFTVFAAKGQQADTKLNIHQGVNITVNLKFKKEGIFTHLPYNTSFRIRVWYDDDTLAATWYSSLYDESIYAGVQHVGSWAYAGYAYGGAGEFAGFDVASADESRNWVRDSTTDLQVLLAGNYLYTEPDWYCVCPAGDEWAEAYGIDGWPNYQGTYRIEVEAINWYFSEKSFPAPPGLLSGAGYYIINGVEGPYGGIWRYNHLGPWEQRMVINVPNAHLGAEASVVFELDLRGLLSGQVAGFTWSDELRPVSWASITASGAGGTFESYTWDGYYDMYLPTGSYDLTVAVDGYVAQSQAITVSTGALVTGFSFYLERSNIPIPEFPLAIVGLVSALGASLYVLRRTRRKG